MIEDHNLTREELLEALAKSQTQVNILQKALLEDSNQASESLYKEIVEGQTDMITRWMPDTTATYVNQAYCKYFGGSVEDFIGKQFLPNLPEETQLIVKDVVVKLITGQAETYVTEEKSVDAAGNTHWIQWTYSVLRNDSGELAELQSAGRDITELKQARIALEQANMVVEQSPVVLYRREVENDRPGKIIFVTENVKQYGYTAEEFLTGRIGFEEIVHPDDLTKVGRELISNIVKGVDNFQHEYRMLRKDQSVVWVTLQTTIERNEKGEAEYFQGSLVENTARKLAEIEREMVLMQTQSLYEMSAKMSMASGLDEILTAATLSISPVDLHRSYLLRISVDEASNLESVRIIANWGAEGEENLYPVGTVFPAQMHDAFQMLLTREPFIIGDMTTDERLDAATRKVLTGNGMRSAVVLSLFDGQELFGGILMESRDVFEFSGSERHSLGMISTQLSAAVRNELLLQTTNQRAQALATVAEVATAVTEIQEPQMALKQVVNLTKERFGYYHAHVYRLNETGDMLRLVSGAGKIGDQMVAEERTIPFDAEQSLVARAARTRKGVIVNDVTADANFLPHPLLPDTKAEMAVPMLSGTDVLGVLDVQAADVYRFTQDDVDVLTTLASQVAVSLLNAIQYDEIRQSEMLVRTVVDSTSDWIFIKDLNIAM